MKTFQGFRTDPPRPYLEMGLANAPELPQYQGIIFDTGTCVLQWLTETRSISIFDSYDSFFKIHGHSEYGTVIVWS